MLVFLRTVFLWAVDFLLTLEDFFALVIPFSVLILLTVCKKFATILLMSYYQKRVEDALSNLGTSVSGLSTTQAEQRLKQYGANVITPKTKPLWRIIVQPFLSVFMGILVFAAIISFAQGITVDGVIVLAVLAVSAIMDYAQEYSTSRILRSLRNQKVQHVTVRRSGSLHSVISTQIVPGDIVILEEGDKVPADLRIIDAQNLRVNESQLTGESLPISKTSSAIKGKKEVYEQRNQLFQGSYIVGGSGTGLVVATGDTTEFGRMAALTANGFEKSPVEKKIDSIVSWVVIVVLTLTIVIFGLQLMRGIPAMEALRFTIAIAVSAVPEGLPVAISVILAYGMRMLAKKRGLVRNSSAMESIGVITTIATDKTGTLTQNKLSVQEYWPTNGSLAELKNTAACAALHATLGKMRDPLDEALSQALPAPRSKAAKEYPFEHESALSAALYHHGATYQLAIKGAPEAIMHLAKLTESEHERATATLHHMTGLGFRVIAFASLTTQTPPENLRHIPSLGKATFQGFIAIADTLRREAKPAIARAKAAGITVRMITGDHFETAFHIGRELGLVNSRDQVFDTSLMSKLDNKRLEKIIQNTYVFSRVTPDRKHRILSLLKKHDITAMTGDGVNDTPALANAHVGIAMGSGSDIAKDAGDIILLNDNFKTIVDAISIGRTIYSNIRRMVTYLLATNVGEVLVSLGSLLSGMPLPLVPIQILWINLVTDTITVIPLGMEPEHGNIMKAKPTSPKAPLLSKFVIGQITVVAIFVAATTYLCFWASLTTHNLSYAQTIAFHTLAISQWGIVFALRATLTPIWQLFKAKNPLMYAGLALSLILQIAALCTPLGQYLHVVPIRLEDAIICAVAALTIPVIAVETYKYLGRYYNAKV